MEPDTKVFLNKFYILAIVMAAGAVVFFFGHLGYENRTLDLQNQNQITVSGTGKIYAKPDVALISLGVTSEAKTVADATKNGTDKMNAVIEAVKKLGVDEKDIQTTNYNLTPVYEDYSVSSPTSSMMYQASGDIIRKTGTTVTGYRLEQNAQVKIRDFTKIGEIISKSTATGANLVGDLQFTIDNPEQFREQARAKAIAQAKSNAKNLAKESGIGLGKLINVYEGYNPIMYSSQAKLGMGAGSADMAAPAPVIQPGQQEIDVTINLTYKVN